MKSNRIAFVVLTGILVLVTGAQAEPADVVATKDANTKVTMLNERDLMIQAASQTASVVLHFAGADRIDFGPAGELSIIKNNGNLVHYRPDVYQMINGKVQPVAVSYKMNGKDRVTMNFGKFNKAVPLILHRGAATL